MNRPSPTSSTQVFPPEREEVVWLTSDWAELVERCRTLGPVRVETHDRTAGIAKRGIFDEVDFDEGPVGLVTGGEIDLRLFTNSWRWAWATPLDTATTVPPALRIADEFGRIATAIELSEDSETEAYRELLEAFETDPPEELEPEGTPERPSMSVEDVDDETRESFRQAWRDLGHTHEFHRILHEHGLERRIALEVGPEELARLRDPEVLRSVIEGADERSIPLMLFVSSGGCLQIHTGPTRLEAFDDTHARIEGPDLEMEVRLDRIDEAWVVIKPTDDGYVTSVEFFDEASELAFQIFGERKPGGTEREDWRQLVDERVAGPEFGVAELDLG